jgi:hypothetical protein
VIGRLLTVGAIGVGLIVAAVVGVTAYQALHTPLQASGDQPLTPENCSPGPCADVQGFTLWMSDVTLTGDVVSMQVKFRNSSPATHASPEDLQLIDASRHASGLITDAPNCKSFTRHEFSNGATYGPINICFRVSNATRPFILRWSPDLGLFCCETNIKLT